MRRVRKADVAYGVGLVLLCMVAGLFLNPLLGSGARKGSSSRASVAAAPKPVESGGPHPRSARRRVRPYQSVVARARVRSVRVYTRRRGRKPRMRVSPHRIEGVKVPLVFLVRKRERRWLQVYLPTRPNLSKGWIRRSDVRLRATIYHVRVELRRHRLTVWRGREMIARKPIGTGKSVSPTPTGRYYVTDLIRARDPKGLYGPYAFGLSGHSPVYTSFRGGTGQLGLHGTNAPEALGSDVSAGCIRIGNGAITVLARLLPLGTPVTIER